MAVTETPPQKKNQPPQKKKPENFNLTEITENNIYAVRSEATV